MRVSIKQKRAIEKISGKPWDTWGINSIKAYFAFTDTGKQTELSENKDKTDFEDILSYHRTHPIIIECLKVDFKSGIATLWDYLGQGYPDAYIEHIFDIYYSTYNYMPSCYRSQKDTPMKYKDY